MSGGGPSGYGPRNSLIKRLCFDGDEEKYDIWEIKFLSHLRLQKLSIDLDSDDGSLTGSALTSMTERYADVFAELVQVLNDKSLQLVMRDAVGDGKKAMKILRDHYRGNTKPRIISLYTVLTSLKMEAVKT